MPIDGVEISFGAPSDRGGETELPLFVRSIALGDPIGGSPTPGEFFTVDADGLLIQQVVSATVTIGDDLVGADANGVVYADGSSQFATDPNFTYDGTGLTVVGSSTIGGVQLNTYGAADSRIKVDKNYFGIQQNSNVLLWFYNNTIATGQFTALAKLHVRNTVSTSGGLIVDLANAQTANAFEINSFGGSGGDLVTVLSDGKTAIGNTTPKTNLHVGPFASYTWGTETGIWVGDATKNSGFRAGQGNSNSAYMVWSYDATPANASFVIGTYGNSNPIAINGSVLALQSTSGNGVVIGSASITADTQFEIITNAATSIGQRIELANGQTANAFEINSYGGSGGDLVGVDSGGNLNAYDFITASSKTGNVPVKMGGYPGSETTYAGLWTEDTPTTSNFSLLAGNSSLFLNTQGQSIYFRVANANKMQLNASGNLVLGADTATARVHIVNTSSVTVAQKIDLANAQSANAFEINSFGGSGGDLVEVSPSGVLKVGFSALNGNDWGPSGYATFGHPTATATSSFAVIQGASGTTFVNSFDTLYFRIANSTKATLTATEFTTGAQVITNVTTTTVAQKIDLANAQTANAFEINSFGGSGGDLVNVTKDGWLGIGGTPTELLHVISAGAWDTANIKVESTNTAAGARFSAINDAGKGAYFNVYGSLFSVTELRNMAGFGADDGIRIFSDAALSSGGTNDIEFSAGGYANINFIVKSTGLIGFNETTPTAQTHTTVGLATTVGQKIDLANAQTANAFEINSFGGSGGDLFKISSSGVFKALGANNYLNSVRTTAGFSWYQPVTVSGGNGLVLSTSGTIGGSSSMAYGMGVVHAVNQSGTAGYATFLAHVTKTAEGSGDRLFFRGYDATAAADRVKLFSNGDAWFYGVLQAPNLATSRPTTVGEMYQDTAANILANGDLVVGIRQ